MAQRRSRRAQKKSKDVAPEKTEEDPDAEADGDDNTAESEEDNDAKSHTTASSSRPRRRRTRKSKGSEASENEDNSSDEGKSQGNTDTGASSDEEDPSTATGNQSPKRTRRTKKSAEADEVEQKTPKRRGRPRKNVEPESNGEEGTDGEKETIRKSKRRNAGRRRHQDSSSEGEDEQPKKVARRRGRPRKNQEAEDGDSKVNSAEEESANEEESTMKVKRRRGRPRKNQDTEDGDSKMETGGDESVSEEEPAKKTPRRRGRPRKNQDADDNDSKMNSGEEESAVEEESAKKVTRRRGRPRKSQDADDNDSKVESADEESEGEEEQPKKVTRRRGRPRKNPDADDGDSKMDTGDEESEGEEGQPKKVTRRRGRPRKNRDADDGDSKMNSDEEEDSANEEAEEESTKKVTRRRGRPRKNQDTEDYESKVDSGDEDADNEEESTKMVTRRRGRPRKNQDVEDNDSKVENTEENDGSGDEDSENEEESTKKVTRRRGRPRKNKEADDSDSKMESASEGEPTKKVTRKRGRPRKNQDTEENDSKMETAEEEESGSEKESTKKVTRRRGRPRKNKDVEDNDSKVDSGDEQPENDDESPNKVVTRRRGRPRKKEDSTDNDSKVENAEEDDGSGDDENDTAKSEDASNHDKTTGRPKRKRGRPKKSADASSNDEGEKESQPEGNEKNASTRQTPDPSSNDQPTSGDEATRKRSRPGGSRSDSSDKRGSEVSEVPPSKEGSDEVNPENQPTQVSQSRLENTIETSLSEHDSTAPPKNNKDEGPGETSEDKPTTNDVAKTKAAPSDTNIGEGSSSQPEPEEATQESTVESSADSSAPSRRAKRQREPPEQPVDSAASTSNSASVDNKDEKPENHDKKRSRMDMDESAKDANETAEKSSAKQPGPSSNEIKAQTSLENVETKDTPKDAGENSATAIVPDKNDLKPATSSPIPEKKEPIEQPTRSVPTDSPKQLIPPEDEKTETNIVPVARTNSTDKALDKQELPKKIEPPVIKPPAVPSSESKQVVTQTNIVGPESTVQNAGSGPSFENNNSKPNVEKDPSVISTQPTKKVDTAAISVVEASPPTTSVNLKKHEQSVLVDEKKTPEDSADSSRARPKEAEKKANPDGNTSSSMDVDSPVKKAVVMTDVENSKSPPPAVQKVTEAALAEDRSPPMEPQVKPLESTQTVIKPQESAPPVDSGEKISAPSDTVIPVIELPPTSVPSETVDIQKDTIAEPTDSKTDTTDSKENIPADKNLSNQIETSHVTESSSSDEDESDNDSDSENEEVTPALRLETKVLPFNPTSVVPNEKQNSSDLRSKVDRVKMILYTIGSRVHRGRGFERLFSKYWEALTMRLSDRLSSHASRQCNAAIKAFLKSPKLRRIHNKLVLTLMKTSMKSFVPLDEISEYVPEVWHDKVRRVDRVPVEDVSKETKRQRKALAKRAAQKQSTIYSEAWASTIAIEENPTSADCLKTESQEVDMKKILAASASIPGALVIDPLVREISEQSNMRASENAIWLLIVAAREHTSNILKNALQHKKDLESGEVSDPFLQYPRVLAGSKIPIKKDSPGEKVEQQLLAPSDYIPGKCQTRKVVTSFDIYASSLAVPAGPPASLGGAVSTTALELCLQNAYTSSSGFSGTNFSDVQKHIVGGITALALDRKASLLARGEEARSNQMSLTNSQPQVVTNEQVASGEQSMVQSNAQVGAVAPPMAATTPVDMNFAARVQAQAQAQAQAEHHQNTIPAPQQAEDPEQQVNTTLSGATTTVAASPSATPVKATESSPLGAVPGRIGRGAKDLASLMQRTTKPIDSANPAPASDDQAKVVSESAPPSINSSPQKSTEVDELGTSTGSGRNRGRGFGTKNLAAMKARSSKPGEEKEAPRESVPATIPAAVPAPVPATVPATVPAPVPATILTNEPPKRQQPNIVMRPKGGKDLASLSMRGPGGAKDLAALKARSAAAAAAATKTSADPAKQAEGIVRVGEVKLQVANEPKADTNQPAASSQAIAPAGAPIPSKPPNTAGVTAPIPANDAKLDSTNKADTEGGDKSAKPNEGDDKAVVVGVIPAVQNAVGPSSEAKGATGDQPTEPKPEDKDVNTTTTPASTTETPNAASAGTEKPTEAGATGAASVTAEVKVETSATKEHGGSRNSANPPAAAAATTSNPTASGDAPLPKGAESSTEATKSAESEKTGEENTGKLEGTKADESKPEAKNKEDASTQATKDEKAESSK